MKEWKKSQRTELEIVPVPNTSPGERPSPAADKCVICWYGVQCNSLRLLSHKVYDSPSPDHDYQQQPIHLHLDTVQKRDGNLRSKVTLKSMSNVALSSSCQVRCGGGAGSCLVFLSHLTASRASMGTIQELTLVQLPLEWNGPRGGISKP